MIRSILASKAQKRSRFASKVFTSKLSILAVSAFIGMTSQGWGSIPEHHKLDDWAIMKWHITKKPMMHSVADQKYIADGGEIHKQNEFSIEVRRTEGLNKIRVLYYGSTDHSLTPLDVLERRVEFVSSGELREVLGIKKPVYDAFMERLGVSEDTPTFPSNLVEGYQFMETNELTSRFIRSHTDTENSIWSIAGGPVSALGAVKLLIESYSLNRGKPVRFHLNVMGFLPDISWNFLEALKLKNRMRAIVPTQEGKWFPVFKKELDPKTIDFYYSIEKASK